MGGKKDKKKRQKSKLILKTKDTKIKKNKNSEIVEDIDLILADLENAQKSKNLVEVVDAIPSRRANCSLTQFQNHIYLFGGEYYDGLKVWMYNHFYRFNVEKLEWKQYIFSTGPGPRSSHQVVISPTGILFLWGGEFVSPNETNFFHYKDFWSIDLNTIDSPEPRWERLDIDGTKPSPRSGHRMVGWKHYLILFGGFHDQTNETKYYNDLFYFNTKDLRWTKVESQYQPSPRSGFQFYVHNDTCVMYGGYAKVNEKGKKVVGVMYTDTWILKLSLDPSLSKWEKKRKAGGMPPVERSGCTTVYHKGKGIMFGGITDTIESEETIQSVIHNDLTQYLVDSNKWYSITSSHPRPSPRFNAALCTFKNNLYLFGGLFEVDEKEFCMADFWVADLDKGCLIPDSLFDQEWKGIESSDDESDSTSKSDDDSENDDDSCNGSDQELNLPTATITSNDINLYKQNWQKIDERLSDVITGVSTLKKPSGLTEAELKSQQENDARPGECMADYHTRCNIYFQDLALREYERTGKTLRRKAFTLAYERYTELRPSNEILERLLLENSVCDLPDCIDAKKNGEAGVRSRNR